MGQPVAEIGGNPGVQSGLVTRPKLLPPDFQFPRTTENAITGLLKYSREDMLTLRDDRDYQPTPEVTLVLNEFDAIFTQRETEALTQEELETTLTAWATGVPEDESRVIATQLRDLGAIMGNMRGRNRPAATSAFLSKFCPTYRIDPKHPETVFTSDIQHPGVQALTLRYLRLSTPDLDFAALEGQALALRWYFLPRNDNFTVRGLVGSLNAFALRAATTGEEERAIELFDAGAELAFQVEDPVWRMMTENKIMTLSGLGLYQEASLAYDDFYAKAAESLEPLVQAIMDGNRLVTRFAYYRQTSAEGVSVISIEQWQELAAQITKRIPLLEEAQQMASVLELKITLADIQRRLERVKEAGVIEGSLGSLAREVYPSEQDLEQNMHPALIEDGRRIYQAT